MTISQTIEQWIRDVLVGLDISYEGSIVLEHPRELSHGDFATNIAMVLAKQEHANPRELAEKIVAGLQVNMIDRVSAIEVAGPGFINFRLAADFFASELNEIKSQGDQYGFNNSRLGQKILVEHSSPNLFKPFHIGHMMNNTVGESVCRLARATGAEVSVISYPSDVSLGIGKAVWKFMEYGVETIFEYSTISDKMRFLGKCYAEGTQAFRDDPSLEPRIREITQDIYEGRDTEAYRAYQIGKDLNLEYFTLMTQRLGSKFDDFIFESEAGKIGKDLVIEHTPDIYSRSDGAIIYEGEKDGLHTRVFINKDGNPTYEAKDTGLLKLKFDRFNPDLSLFVTDHQQQAYFQVVEKAAGNINPIWEERTCHITHGRMQFKGEKMSSRLGNTPLVSDILEAVGVEVQSRAKSHLDETSIDAISLAALKYSILRVQAGKDTNFDPETSLSFEGDSGPYIQYTYARTQTLLAKAQTAEMTPNLEKPENWETTELEKLMYRFPSVVRSATDSWSPHLVVTFVTEFAQAFNSWYGQGKIIDTDNSDSAYKLALVDASATIIKNALWLLGINVLKSM
jgi:arginyl-tRNA synthetase